MSFMKDKNRTISDIGRKVRELRKLTKTRTAVIAEKSGRSRDVLNRLEKGQDVSLSSLMAILAALGHGIEIVKLGPPTLEEMQRRTAAELEDGDDE